MSKKVKSCGQACIEYLLSEYGVKAVIYPRKKLDIMSFYDFEMICESHNLNGESYFSKDILRTPCIVQLKILNYEHFIVIVEDGCFIKYWDYDKKYHFLFKPLFNWLYSGFIFYISVNHY